MSRGLHSFLLLLGLVVLIYSNTLNASWHLDDISNITDKKEIHVKDLRPETLLKTVYYNGKINRPFARLSLALNWYFGKDRVTGYHVVNITIHLLTAFFLFLTILALFKTPNISGRYKDSEYFIALLASVLWAANPVQTQAVTYIVQRMASMAALFYLVSLYFYIEARLADSKTKKIWLFSGCVVTFLLALGTKESAAMLPATLILVEVIFFRDIHKSMIGKKILITGSAAAALVFLLACFFQKGNFFSFLDYTDRYFSLWERVLTQPRVVVFYLSQLFYPVPTRLCIEHYFPLSTSLFHPWTTLPAMGLIVVLIGLSFWQIRKRPFLSFAVFFFFLNHIVESTIIPLEMVFEHRNYLPSFFLFVPVVAGLKFLMDSYRSQQSFMYYIIMCFAILLVTGIGLGTYVRNMAWKNEKVLWEDAKQKTPQHARPYHNLAYSYYERIGEYDKAIELYKKADDLWHHSKKQAPLTANNIAGIYFEKGDWEKSVHYLKKALDIRKEAVRPRYRLALVYAEKLDYLEKALRHINIILAQYPDHYKALSLKGFVYLKQNQPKKALACFRRCLKIDPYRSEVLRSTAAAFYQLRDYTRAEMYLKYLHPHFRQDILTALYLVAINLKTNNMDEAEHYTNFILRFEKEDNLKISLSYIYKNKLMSEKDQKVLFAWFTEKLEKGTEEKVRQLKACAALEDNGEE